MHYVPEPHQTLLTDFLTARPRAGGFASPGLGKSAATLHAFQTLMADGVARAMLVVAPLRVATLTWPNEIAKWDFSRDWRVENLRRSPSSGKAHISTVNYESLHKLDSLDKFDVIVFDELTRAKNHTSKRINALRKLLRPHHQRWGLTGTPRPNSLLEIFAQIRLLDDGKRLGPSYHSFRQAWFKPTDYMEYNWVPREGSEKAIYDKIADLTITLRASDYLDIPDTIVEDVDVALPDEAQKAYKELERDLVVYLNKDDTVVAPNAAVLVGKLLQLTGGQIYDETRNVVPVHDAKIKALREVCKSLGSERAIIYTNFIHERERVVASLPGAVDAAKFKGDIEDAWNSGKLRWLVADPRSLGHGLNLQVGGRNVIWYSPNHSRELYDQANARLARKGQTDTPRIFRLLCPGTVDDAVVETLRNRGDAQGEMMEILTNYRRLLCAQQ